MNPDRRQFNEMSDAPHGLFEDILFPTDLGSIIQVHPLAAATAAEPWTGGGPPLGRALNDLVRLGKINTPAAADLPHRDEISRCGEGNENDPIVQMAKTVAARNKLFDPHGRRGGVNMAFLLSWGQ
jgi:hypothetical protein